MKLVFLEIPNVRFGMVFQDPVTYAAGYIPRSLNKILSKSSHPLKKELRLCLAELVDDDDEDLCLDDSKDWLHKSIEEG